MKLILREWPPVTVTDIGINIDDIQGAVSRETNDLISQKALKSIHKKYWLLCSCNKSDPAALTVRRMNENQYCLVNIKDRGKHVAGCPLRYTSLLNKKNNSQGEKKHSFLFNTANSDNTPRSIIYSADNKEEQIPSLLRLKEYLVAQAGMFSVKPNQTFLGQSKSLYSAVEDDVFVNAARLKDRFYFGYRNFFDAKERLVKELERDELLSPLFLVDIIDEVEKSEHLYKFTKFYKNTKPFSFRLFDNISAVKANLSIGGPYIIISQLGAIKDTKGNNVIAPVATIIEPIASKQQWVPISNQLIRDAINKIESSINWYDEKLNLTMTADLCNRPVKTEIGSCEPLFIFKLGDQRAVFDIQLDYSSTQKTKKSLEYIIASKIGGGGFCSLSSEMTNREKNNVLFNSVAMLTKELKRSNPAGDVFSGQIIEIK
ncbi:MAG: hypothetical protein CML20_18620 [Rheinheimera sp.]|nr:hypothetical protein [Rheinheimera sp.]|tara:strand:- start:778 stop:2067 length:1290 start_codon:yes stop_codon:yes gene_type:complete